MSKNKSVAIDFDDTIFVDPKDKDHVLVGKPLKNAVSNIQRLQDAGFKIVIWSARMNKDFRYKPEMQREIISKALQAYNVPYDEIFTEAGKPHVDYILDDKAFNIRGDENQSNWDEVTKYILSKSENTISQIVNKLLEYYE